MASRTHLFAFAAAAGAATLATYLYMDRKRTASNQTAATTSTQTRTTTTAATPATPAAQSPSQPLRAPVLLPPLPPALAAPLRSGQLSTLTDLDLRDCDLAALPAAIGGCSNLRTLELGGNRNLATLPDELALCARLEVLFILGSDKLVEVPRVLGRMPSLTRLGLRSNAIATIAADALPPNVEHLILTSNRLTTIDVAVFDRLTKVRKLMLANNAIKRLPAAGVAKLRSLELLRLANNRLEVLPVELFQLPRLAWLALHGNPMTAAARPTRRVPSVEAKAVTVDMSAVGELGEGASGKVRAGTWRGRAVAAKYFKGGDESSDGRALDEVALFAAVGDDHPSITSCVAVLDAPGEPLGVLMERLPDDHTDLALPPTIAEVTKDRYGAEETFDAAYVVRVLSALSSALAYLHGSLRIAHGDVYAHNTLVNTDASSVRLGDFGAAFPYSTLAIGEVRSRGVSFDRAAGGGVPGTEGGSPSRRVSPSRSSSRAVSGGQWVVDVSSAPSRKGESKQGEAKEAEDHVDVEGRKDALAALVERIEVRAFGVLVEELASRIDEDASSDGDGEDGAGGGSGRGRSRTESFDPMKAGAQGFWALPDEDCIRTTAGALLALAARCMNPSVEGASLVVSIQFQCPCQWQLFFYTGTYVCELMCVNLCV